MLVTGNAFTVVVTEAEAVQPLPSVTVTVKVPAVFTDFVCVVVPPVHN